jgi:hypothetical protein
MLTSSHLILVAMLASFAVLTTIFGWMRGNGPSSAFFLLIQRIYHFAIIYFVYAFFLPKFTVLLWIYAPFYFDLTEHVNSFHTSTFLTMLWLWGIVRKSIKPKLVITTPIRNQCIFAIHPHGILPLGSILNMCHTSSDFAAGLPDVKNWVILAARACFIFPLFREVLLSAGIHDCSRFNFKGWLMKGYSVGIFPGGAREGLYSNPFEDRLDLKRKRGFIRLALEYGVDVVPCYTFNEVDSYRQVPHDAISRLENFIRTAFNKYIGLTLPFLHNIIPNYVVPPVTVIGEPLKMPKIQDPSDEEIQRYWLQYVEALMKLYATHGSKYNSRERQLVVS